MRIVPISEEYRIRHKILGALQSLQIPYDELDPSYSMEDFTLTLKGIASKAKLSKEKILTQIDYLIAEKNIELQWNIDTPYFIITQIGIIAFHEKKYLKSGKTSFYSSLKETISSFSTLALVIIAIATFISNYRDVKQNAKDIQALKEEVQKLTQSLNQKALPTPKPVKK